MNDAQRITGVLSPVVTPLDARVLVCLVLVLALTGCSATPPRTGDGGVTIGALLPLTGSLKSYGESSRAALDVAVETLNARGGPRVRLVVDDTRTDPAAALAALTRVEAQGIRLAIGPYASSEVKAAKDFADRRGVILVSPLSTARSLAVPGDNIFRFTPDDAQEAAAVAALAWADGVRAVVPVSRDDEGNQGLQAAFKPAFEKLGGRVLDGVTYGARREDFSGDIAALVERVTRARQANVGRVAVYLTAFDEVVRLFEQITTAGASAATLQSVPWYGSDSVAQSKELVASARAARFALSVGYPNPILGLDETARATWGPVADRIRAKLGRAPDAFALAAYDALMVGHQALLSAGTSADAATLRRALTAGANAYVGLTGRTTLNAAGDRASGDYDFWAVCREQGRLVWGKAATYAGARATRLRGCDQEAR